MDLEDLERRLREAVDAIPSEARPLLIEMVTADEERRAVEIGHLHAAGVLPATVDLLIDAEGDPYVRAVLVGMLRDA